MRPETLAIHVGHEPDAATGSIVPPIYQTSTYVQDGIGQDRGFVYSRTGNPSRSLLEKSLAAVEGAKYGLCFASGMSAINNILLLLESGSHVICPASVYGGTFRILEFVYKRFGIEADFVDVADIAAVERAIRANTRMLWLESPTNPLLGLCDIEALSALARSKGLTTVVDNTFATAVLQRPLELGADIVIHSTTKYIGGHLDVLGGACLTNDDGLYERLRFLQNAVGAVQGPFDCWLLARGVKTLSLRVKQQSANAEKVARFLEEHPKVRRVHYPGLPSHPQHQLARKQMKGFGAMVSFEVNGDASSAQKLVAHTKLFALGESLGGVRSLVCIPAKQTHASMTPEARERAGISDTLVRLSVGLEHPDDLIEDLVAALDTV